jgi:Calx-beta domain
MAIGSVSINDVNIVEGNSGTQLATFTVLRSGGTDPFDVSYATSDNTATAADRDYIPTSDTLQFATGVNAQTFTVTINGDTKVEPNETFFVNLSGATIGTTISKSQGTGTIINDDASGSVAVNDVNIVEGNSGTQVATFTVTRTGTNATAPFDVSYATADSTATAADGDYVPTSGTLHFGVFVNTQTISITINGDTKFEPNEAFFVGLSGATNSAVITKNVGTGTIVNDDGPPPPAGTTADMILRNTNGTYEIYDIGNNAILAGYKLGQLGTDWTFAGLGGFFGSDTTDMMLRSAATGAFEVYDISNNNITNAAFLGTVGLNWQVMGFGDFNGDAKTDMALRNVNTGGIETYNISNNQIVGASFLGTVGLNWQFSGIGDFNGDGQAGLMLRNSTTGGLEVYNIANNQIVNASFMGTVGLNWQFSGIGDFNGDGASDMMLRNANTGGLEVYDINSNQITGAAFIGTVGLDWQFAGVAPVHAAGASDLVLRNVNTGQFEVYNIANNQITGAALLGAVGLDWQLGGFAVDPPTGSTASMGDSSQAAALVQAMAGFGGGSGAADGLNTVPLGADTSQQPLLTTPQHA